MATTVLVAGAVCVSAGPAHAQGLLALGDSYASGEGVPPYDAGTNVPGNRCHRSQGAWPILTAQELGLAASSWACSGAETDEIAAQLRRATGAPSIVVLTAGGNDVGFRDVLERCVTGLAACHRFYTRSGVDRIERDIRAVEDDLAALYGSIRAALPAARVVVVGYPRIFPAKVPGKARQNCAAWLFISPAEADYLNEKADALNRAIRRAARRAGVEVVDVADAFRGHELRCRGEPWVHRLRVLRGEALIDRSSFHPTWRGHRRIADLVTARLAAG